MRTGTDTLQTAVIVVGFIGITILLIACMYAGYLTMKAQEIVQQGPVYAPAPALD